ncbi:polyprenyl synthetase family protein [Crossiella cryophila]
MDFGADDLVLSTELANSLADRWRLDDDRLGEICRYALLPPGKLLRPMLLVESAVAVGGTRYGVLPAAVGAESGHTASLVHDDIIDQDELRRGRPAVHVRYGVDDAIVTGDALLFDLFAGLAGCRYRGVAEARIVDALAEVARCGVELCRGQMLEAELTRDRCFDAARYRRMVHLKTAALFRGACVSGALLAGGSAEEVAALRRYADELGIAYQIQDDLLGYLSVPAVTGKPQASDARNGRITMPLILAGQAGGPAARRAIERQLCGGGDAAARHARLRRIVAGSGALDEARDLVREAVGRAGSALAVLPPGASRTRLRRVAELLLDRDR